MYQFTLGLLGLAGGTLLATLAWAKDVSYKDDAPAAFNWTGIYAGGQVGWGRMKQTDTVGVQSRAWAVEADNENDNLNNYLAANNYQSSQSHAKSDKGFTFGAHIGGHYQFGKIVIGGEGRFDSSKLKLDPERCDGRGTEAFCVSTEADWLAAALGKLGFSHDRWLIYGSFGMAWAKVKGAGKKIAEPEVEAWPSLVASDTIRGVAYGGGLSYAITNQWILSADYLRYDMKDQKRSDTVTHSDAINMGLDDPVRIDSSRLYRHKRQSTFDTVTVRMSYRFGD